MTSMRVFFGRPNRSIYVPYVKDRCRPRDVDVPQVQKIRREQNAVMG